MATKAKTKSGGLSAARRNRVPSVRFAFPKQRKEPLNDAKHVRNAIARFDQVQDVSDSERDSAWRRIQRAAKKFSIDVSKKSWRQLGDDGKPAKKAKTPKKTGGKSRKGKKNKTGRGSKEKK